MTAAPARAALVLAAAVLLSAFPAAPVAAQTQPASPSAWLDSAGLPRWNRAGAPVPAAPRPAAPAPANPACTSAERAPETAEDRQVTGAGWRLASLPGGPDRRPGAGGVGPLRL